MSKKSKKRLDAEKEFRKLWRDVYDCAAPASLRGIIIDAKKTNKLSNVWRTLVHNRKFPGTTLGGANIKVAAGEDKSWWGDTINDAWYVDEFRCIPGSAVRHALEKVLAQVNDDDTLLVDDANFDVYIGHARDFTDSEMDKILVRLRQEYAEAQAEELRRRDTKEAAKAKRERQNVMDLCRTAFDRLGPEQVTTVLEKLLAGDEK